MPHYDYECGKCGRLEERFFQMSAKPETVECACGGSADSVISSPEVFVKAREYVFDKARNVMSGGRKHGRTDAQQHEIYRRRWEEMKTEQDRVRRSGVKRGCQWLGGMPAEMADSIGCHENDKQAVYKDPVPFLKKTGLYAGDD